MQSKSRTQWRILTGLGIVLQVFGVAVALFWALKDLFLLRGDLNMVGSYQYAGMIIGASLMLAGVQMVIGGMFSYNKSDLDVR